MTLKHKVYIPCRSLPINMIPGNLYGSPDEYFSSTDSQFGRVI